MPSETDDEDFELAVQPALPSLEEGEYRLDLVREEGNEFSPRLQFPGPLAPRYPVVGYPRIAEFRRMLEELDLDGLCQWQGYYFYAHTAIVENEQRGVFFFARENGIAFRFPMEHWQSIRNLFRRAWQAPEVIHAGRRRCWNMASCRTRCFAPEEGGTRHPQIGNCGAPDGASMFTQVNFRCVNKFGLRWVTAISNG